MVLNVLERLHVVIYQIAQRCALEGIVGNMKVRIREWLSRFGGISAALWR